MKILTILVVMFSLLNVQAEATQSNDRGTEVLFVIAAISNVPGSVQRTVYTLPSGRERAIYNFGPKEIHKKDSK